jgi:hypothetical protein
MTPYLIFNINNKHSKEEKFMTYSVTITGNTLEELFANAGAMLTSRNSALAAQIPAVSAIPVAVTPAPAASPAPVVPVVPVAAAPAYAIDDLAKAGAELAQSGKMEDCVALLKKYNIPSLHQLPQEQYGAFATELRALGAKL